MRHGNCSLGRERRRQQVHRTFVSRLRERRLMKTLWAFFADPCIHVFVIVLLVIWIGMTLNSGDALYVSAAMQDSSQFTVELSGPCCNSKCHAAAHRTNTARSLFVRRNKNASGPL